MDRETADDIKRHFGVVAERLESKIQTLAEVVNANHEAVQRDIAALDNRFAQRIDTVELVVRGHTDTLERIERKLDRKADVETVAALESRVFARLEREHR